MNTLVFFAAIGAGWILGVAFYVCLLYARGDRTRLHERDHEHERTERMEPAPWGDQR